jgi:hypothetical protein
MDVSGHDYAWTSRPGDGTAWACSTCNWGGVGFDGPASAAAAHEGVARDIASGALSPGGFTPRIGSGEQQS